MKRFCTLNFNDGTSIQFAFDQQADPMVVAGLIDESLDRNTIAFEVDGQLQVFPMANIRSIAINPAPEKLPRSVIQGVSVV